MAAEIAWMDKDRNRLTMNQISDRYLISILSFLCRGGGFTSFINKDKIHNLFLEAARRNLDHRYTINKAIKAYEDKVDTQHIYYLEQIPYFEEF